MPDIVGAEAIKSTRMTDPVLLPGTIVVAADFATLARTAYQVVKFGKWFTVPAIAATDGSATLANLIALGHILQV